MSYKVLKKGKKKRPGEAFPASFTTQSGVLFLVIERVHVHRNACPLHTRNAPGQLRDVKPREKLHQFSALPAFYQNAKCAILDRFESNYYRHVLTSSPTLESSSHWPDGLATN